MNVKTGFAGALLTVLTGVILTACTEQDVDRASSVDNRLVVKGAGATFPQPLYARWIEAYRQEHPEVDFTYEGVGSGEGVKRFLAGTIDFGASDAAMRDAELAQVDPERGVAMIPMTAGMVVMAYNIPGVGTGLTLERDVYRDIFAGRIRSWDDPRIRASNPGLELPRMDIVTVVRRESSGTTFALTNHLGAIDPRWTAQGPGVGKVVDWPGSAMTALGNEGVAQRVRITDGSIGYVAYELAHRLGLPMATLENAAGRLVAPSPHSGQAALASATDIPEDLRVYLPDQDGEDAYPIVSYSWLLLNKRYPDSAKAEALKEALGWGLDQGQTIAADMGYIPLPQIMIDKAKASLAQIR